MRTYTEKSYLEKALKNKIEQILENPYHYKTSKYDLAAERRVHIIENRAGLKPSMLRNQRFLAH